MVASRMGQPAVWDGEAEDSSHRQLTARELKALSDEGWDIGSHTLTHARMTDLSAERTSVELLESKKAIADAIGREPDWFAYPYGAFDSGLREAVSRAGYRMAFATEGGDGDPFSIPRRIISGRNGLLKFAWRLFQAGRLARR
jgi:peptidoglycan/xylan/chitin deacetylase (PgdA/CDA1 family)